MVLTYSRSWHIRVRLWPADIARGMSRLSHRSLFSIHTSHTLQSHLRHLSSSAVRSLLLHSQQQVQLKYHSVEYICHSMKCRLVTEVDPVISPGPTAAYLYAQEQPKETPSVLFNDLYNFQREMYYISRLCYDVSVRLSVRLSVTEVHWRIIANLGFKFRSKFTAHCGRGACGREERDHRWEEWMDHLSCWCRPKCHKLQIRLVTEF